MSIRLGAKLDSDRRQNLEYGFLKLKTVNFELGVVIDDLFPVEDEVLHKRIIIKVLEI